MTKFNHALFARIVKAVRKSRGLTSAQLADNCGLTRSTVWRIEKGDMKTSVDSLYAIVSSLNLDFNDFINESEE